MDYTFKTEPYRHQRAALTKALRNQRAGRQSGQQVPMRYGKSKTFIDFAGCMFLLGKVNRVLIVTVASGISVLEDEIATHCGVPYEIVTKDDIRAATNDQEYFWHFPQGILYFHVTNYEATYARDYWNPDEPRTWMPVTHKGIANYDPDLVCADESHHIGNPNTLNYKTLRKIGARAKYRAVMTGTMFHRKPLFVYGQMSFLDPTIFGQSYTEFKSKITLVEGTFGEPRRYMNLGWMMNKVKPHVYMKRHVPKLPPVDNVIHFDLTGTNKDAYNEMATNNALSVSGEEVTAPIVLTKHLRLLQITGGWVRTESGTYRRVGTDKYDIALDRMREYYEQDIGKFVVGCRFLPEMIDAARAARNAGYDVVVFNGSTPKGHERAWRIRAFQRLSRRIAFVAQISAGREAIKLSEADTMMFYSLPVSFLDFDQFRNRIAVYNDSVRTLMYDYLIAKHTHDQVSYQAMCDGQNVVKFIMTNPELVETLTAKV